NPLVTGANGVQEVMALHVWQAEIENDEIRRLREQFERRFAVLRFDDLIALCGQARAQEPPNGRFVVDDQHLERRGAHAASNRCGEFGMGKMIVKMAPLRSRRFAPTIVPCMASTKPREIASPNPVPARTRSAFCAR